MISFSSKRTRIDFPFIGKGVVLFLLLGYLSIAGGKFSGRVVYELVEINTILIIATGLAWLCWRAIRRRAFPETILDGGILLWVAALIIATIFSQDPHLSLEILANNLAYILIFYMLVDLQRSHQNLEQLVVLSLWISLFYLIFGYSDLIGWAVNWFAIGGWNNPLPPTSIRVQASIGHPNILAAYLNLLLPMGLARAIDNKRVWLRVVLLIWCFLVLGLLFFTSSRGGWLASAVLLGCMGILIALDHRQKVKQAWAWLSFRRNLLGGLVTAVLAAGAGMGYILLRQMQNSTHPGLCNPANARDYIWQVGLAEFWKHPWTGVGPGIYPRDFATSYSIPPSMLLPHAHNYLIGVLGETGLPGLTATLVLVALVTILFIRRWKSTPPSRRTLLIGTMAAILGLAVHSLLDIPEYVPLINLLLILFVAQIVPPADPQRRGKTWINLAILAIFIVCAGFAAWRLSSFRTYSLGLTAAGQGDWTNAARLMEEAARQEPQATAAWFQAGFARGKLAFSPKGKLIDRQQAGLALDDYRNGFALNSGYAIDWANVGHLQLSAGDLTSGMASVRHAVALAPDSPILLLQLAETEEQQGLSSAKGHFVDALRLQPAWIESPYFHQTESRNAAVVEFKAWLDQQRNSSSPEAKCLLPQIEMKTPEFYIQTGNELLSKNQTAEARKNFLTAEFISGGSIEPRIALADFYRRTGALDLATSNYKSIIDLLRQTTSYGPGTTNGDYWLLYLRESPQNDLLPGIQKMILTTSQQDALTALQQIDAKVGDKLSQDDFNHLIEGR